MSHIKELFAATARPLPPINSSGFGSYFDNLGKFKVVLLGDGSHGTSEFYAARAEITKRLIDHHGFTVVAVEADWPDAEVIDRYVRQRPGSKSHIGGHPKGYDPFTRFPTWMWRNREMQELVEWMHSRNIGKPDDQKVGFYGLDLYSMGASIQAVINYLDHVDPAAGQTARQRYSCLERWVDDPTAYGLAALSGMTDCEQSVVHMLCELLISRLKYAKHAQDGEEYHSTAQNAHLVRDAERYYKAMYYNSASSWNLRDAHMFETLNRIIQHKSSGNKAVKSVVWAHNSHCGDARYTSMGTKRKEVNIGQLCREKFGRENVALLGCGTHTGTVAAAHEWDEDMQEMTVLPSRQDSWEYIAHETGIPSFLLDLRQDCVDSKLARALREEPDRLERFIGVIYKPETERLSHYSAADLSNQFDSYVWFDCTQAVQPLEKHEPITGLGKESTYPFGL
ncbi:erythromycin esterase-domain-containing protein [Penicillium maclennaniae]|uniref:erythromycin esterase-domain-containing protein n=1 Tax=Penicillium maclennaniae TaxID=1343394 RepID=UPI00254055E4|nr:erythromycin esterase-domain-containing protein [Penicillium maclennaniae]KAJ5666472.1 erythromycin esterase-domain-containing protein [Penicillium maclennaniae]